MSKTVQEYDRYLPVSQRGRLWGLYVRGAGFGQVQPGKPYPRRSHPQSHECAWQRGRVLHEYQAAGEPRIDFRLMGKTKCRWDRARA